MSQNKYLVIGGSSGIGLALSKLLVQNGNEVIIASRRPPEIPVTHIPFDVIMDEFPPGLLPESLEGLVYCPGTITLKPFHRFTDQEFLNDFTINTLGAIRTIRSALPNLKKAGKASIVLFSTVAVAQGMAFHTSVAVSKGALEGLTRSLAAELAPMIRVNCIAPSLTDTPLAARILSSEEKRNASAERHPLKRVGAADDIAHAAEYLLSDKSSWITGQVLHVDGGTSVIRN